MANGRFTTAVFASVLTLVGYLAVQHFDLVDKLGPVIRTLRGVKLEEGYADIYKLKRHEKDSDSNKETEGFVEYEGHRGKLKLDEKGRPYIEY